VTSQLTESYAVEVERRHLWLAVATVWALRQGEADAPVELASFRSLTRAGAKRQATRFVAERQAVAA
jgi:hypothetical protein